LQPACHIGSNINDFTAVTPDHFPTNYLAAEKRAPYIEIHKVIPFFLQHVFRRFPQDNGSVVNQNVYFAEIKSSD
jgi:hypothetical protein